MLVEIKEWEALDRKGLPRAQVFNRIVHGGDIINIADTPVIHEVDSDIDFDSITKKPLKEKLITHPNVQVSLNPNADRQDMTEYEHRKFTIQKSPMAQRWSKADKELFLKYYWYTPDYMKPANRGANATIRKEDSMPEEDGRDIPNVQPGQPTSVGVADTGQYVGKLSGMSNDEAILNVNKTSNATLLNTWLSEAKKAGNEKLVNTIEAQLRTASRA